MVSTLVRAVREEERDQLVGEFLQLLAVSSYEELVYQSTAMAKCGKVTWFLTYVSEDELWAVWNTSQLEPQAVQFFRTRPDAVKFLVTEYSVEAASFPGRCSWLGPVLELKSV